MTAEPISNAKQIWGKVLTRLRESGEVALFVSCGEIEHVEIEDNTLVISSDKQYLVDLVGSNENLLVLKRALRFLGYNLGAKTKFVEGKSHKIEEDINILKDKLGQYLKIE